MDVFSALQFTKFCWVLKTYSSQINSRVEWSLSLFVQGIFQCSWLKLLLRSKRFPFVEERTKIGCKIHFREWLLLQFTEKEQLSIRFVFDFCQLTSNQNAAFERLRDIWKFTLRMCYSQQIFLSFVKIRKLKWLKTELICDRNQRLNCAFEIFKKCTKTEFIFVLSDEVVLKLTQIVTWCTR